jgi:hypothetical protein
LPGAAADAAAQAKGNLFRVGYLAAERGPTPFFAALKEGLRELDIVEGQNLVLEYRSSEDRSRLAALAAELVKLKVDVIVAQGPAALAVKSATAVPLCSDSAAIRWKQVSSTAWPDREPI